MTINKWKDIAETAALIAVVASLIVVAVELRQTQVALQAQAYQTRAFQAFDFHTSMADKPELEELLRRSWEDDFQVESLTTEERYKLERLYYSFRIDVDNEHYQYQKGLLDRSFYLTTTVRDIKLFAPVWRDLGIRGFREEFRTEVDRILADPSIVPAVDPSQ